ncbi:MAG: ABC transporter permease [Clostridiales bacterium]|nr:ABC transporter permease [Clostridiales bacterium]
MAAIIRKELHEYFTSMTGYASISFFLLVIGFFFTYFNLMYADPDYAATIASSIFALIFMAPFMTMRLFAAEKRQKTDILIFTSPVSIASIVVAKVISAITVYLIGMAITIILPLTLAPLGKLPVPLIISAYVGFALLGACFMSLGAFVSSLTSNQIVATISSCVLFVALFAIDAFLPLIPSNGAWSFAFIMALIAIIAALTGYTTKNYISPVIVILVAGGANAALFFIKRDIFTGLIFKILDACSITGRFSNFSAGVLSIADIIFYISFSVAMIVITIAAIEKRRWR